MRFELNKNKMSNWILNKKVQNEGKYELRSVSGENK